MKNSICSIIALLLIVMSFPQAYAASPGDIFTVVGGDTGDGGAATAANLFHPASVAVDSSGNIYIADQLNHRIRKVTAATGKISTVAGNGTPGFAGDGGAATDASLSSPYGVAVDSSGNLYIADRNNHCIRMVDAATGVISTVAGNSTYGGGGDGGAATAASLSYPSGVTVDSSGNLYIADSQNNRIRKVTAATGVISTVAGSGGLSGFAGDGGVATYARLSYPKGVAVDSSGNLYIADSSNHRIRKVTAATGKINTVAGNAYGDYGYFGDGGAATAAGLNYPSGVAVDTFGNLYIAESNNSRIRKVTAATGVISTVAGNGMYCFGGDGGAATAANLNRPEGVAVDSSGNIYIADYYNNRIRKVTAATGKISTIAGNSTLGDGGAPTAAGLNYSSGVAVDSSGNIYIADQLNNRIRKVTAATGKISTVAGNGTPGFAGDGGAATTASLYYPTGVTVDSSGNLYIADYYNNRIRKVTAVTGVISTVAGIATYGFAGDGGAATAASLSSPSGVAVDSSGNIYIADYGNNRIRKVTAATGKISTVAGNGSPGFAGDGGAATAANLDYPRGVTVDSFGSLYIADTYNFRIRKVIAATGVISTVAGNGTSGFAGDGGVATAASLSYPAGVAVDSSGNLYIADESNRIRKVTAATGVISTVAGNGWAGFAGDGGAATAASLYNPTGVTVDSSGNLYIADQLNNRIRKVIKPTYTTAAITYSPAGSYTPGTSVTITATFNDLIADATPPQIAMSGANTLAAAAMTKVDNKTYTYDYTVTSGNGAVTVSIPGGADINGVALAATPVSGGSFTVTNAPVALYQFNGNANDSSGNGYHGTANGVTSTTNQSGTATSAYLFNGSGSVTIPGGIIPANAMDFSVSAVINPQDIPTTGQRIVFYSGQGGEVTIKLESSQVHFGVKLTNGVWYFASAPIPLNQWALVTGVRRGGTSLELWLAGTLQATVEIPALNRYAYSTASIGSYSPANTDFFLGKIDEVRLYTRALESQDIAAIIQAAGLGPALTTLAPTFLTQTSINLRGTARPNGSTTTVTFEYGATTDYGLSVTATQSPIAATVSLSMITAPVTGLICGTTYHYRAKGQNGSAAGYSPDATFTTLACPVVTPYAGVGGNIYPTIAQPVVVNGTTSFTLIPAEGYAISSVSSSCGGALVGNIFTTAPVTQNCSVSALFGDSAGKQQPLLLLANTGQTGCWDASGNLLARCQDSRQDGDIRAGQAAPSPRFTTDDGVSEVTSADAVATTVLDRLTGLEWVRNAGTPATGSCTAGAKTWLALQTYIACLNSANYLGHNDWRIPALKEIESLTSLQNTSPALPSDHPFTNVNSGNYWSSDTYSYDVYDSTDDAYYTFTNGIILDMASSAVYDLQIVNNINFINNYNSFSAPVWPVRSSSLKADRSYVEAPDSPSPRITSTYGNAVLVDSVVDLLYGLEWFKDAGTPSVGSCSGGVKNWQGALDYVACLNNANFQGHRDWRLPNRKELYYFIGKTALDYSWDIFTNMAIGAKYWSSSTFAGTPDYAWTVDYDLFTNISIKGNTAYVWPVRGGLALSPEISTLAASSVTSASATLNGAVSSKGAATNVTFAYGTSAGYGSTAAADQSPLALDAGSSAVSVNLTGLACNTVYHYRLNAVNSAGSVNGNDSTFTTAACPIIPPAATTGAASSVTTTTATLNGTVSSNGASTTVTFQYGTTIGYTSGTATASQSPLPLDASGAAVTADISGLTCGTTYHFRVNGQNSAGPANGDDATFATSACPTHTLTLNKTGNGSGTVSGGGTFTVGSSNQITATADTGFTFAGWSGDCSGASSPLSVTMLARDMTCTATFSDTTPPGLTVSTLADGSVTKESSLNISGSASDASGIKSVTINGVSVGTPFSHLYTLVPGGNLITTIATDNADQTATDNRTITLDQTAPQLAVTAPVDNSITSSPLLTVRGSIDDPTATVTVSHNSGSPQSAIMDGLNFSYGMSLADGINTIQVTATDPVQNSSSLSRTVTCDRQAPSLSVTTPATDITTSQAELTLSGIVSDALSSVTVTITCDGQSYTPPLDNGSFTQKITFTTGKTYAIIVTAEDAAGNKATVQRNVIYQPIRAISVTTTPAGLGITVDGSSYTAPQTFNWPQGSSHTIATTATQNGASGTRYTFANWSDTGTLSHSITTPATSATYTAGFTTQYQITTGVSPAGTGTASPATGSWYAAGTVVPVKAFPNSGYGFISWSGPVAGSASATTSVTMSGPATVTATLGGSPVLTPMITAKSGTTPRTWSVKLDNSGQTTASGARITGLALTMIAGTACTPAINPAQFPVVLGDIAVGGSLTGGVTIDFTGCAATNRYTATISYSSNSGAVSGAKSYANQFK